MTKRTVQERAFTITLTGNDLIAIVQGLDKLLGWYQHMISVSHGREPPSDIKPLEIRRAALIKLRNRLDDLVAQAHHERRRFEEEDDQQEP